MNEHHSENIKSFEDFYSVKIGPLVDDYQAKSKAYDKSGLLLVLSLVLFAAGMGIMFVSDLQGAGLVPFLFFAILLFSIFKFVKAHDSFKDGFKSKVIKEIADFLLPGNEYKPYSFMSTRLFDASCLYRSRAYNIKGDDLIKAVYKNVAFKASELRCFSEEGYTYTSRGWELFSGLFFAADIGTFKGGTYIWRKRNVQIGNSIADEYYRLNPIPAISKIETGSKVFDKYYTVYSTYPAEAHSLLTEEMMQCILSFRHQVKRDISISFVAGRCYVAMPFEEKLLEPALDLTDKEVIKKYFFTILLYPAIINQLKLYKYIE